MTKPVRSLSDQKRYKLESTLTSKVKDWLEIQPDIAFWKASDRYTPGVSDVILSVGGIFTAIELKADDGEASAAQSLFIKTFKASGAVAGVAYTLGEVKDLVEEARRRAKATQVQ